jgi:hypothetical protein
MGTDAETNTERQAGFAVARGDSVALTALRCRQRGAGFPRRTLNWEEGGDFQWIGRALASFRAGGREADGSTEAVFACALAESGLSGFGVWARSRGRAVAIWDRSDLLSGGVSASNSDWRGESQQLRITPRAILPTTFSSSKDQNVTSKPERIRWLDIHSDEYFLLLATGSALLLIILKERAFVVGCPIRTHFRGAKGDNDVRPTPLSEDRPGGGGRRHSAGRAFRAIQSVITALIVKMRSWCENILILKTFFVAFCRRMLHIICREENARVFSRETRLHFLLFMSAFTLVLCRTRNLAPWPAEAE